MTIPKKLAVIGFSGLSGATQVGLNYVKGIEIPHDKIVFIFHGKTNTVTPAYLEELSQYGVESCFARKKTGVIDFSSEYKVFKYLTKYKPENILMVSSAPFLGVLAYKALNRRPVNILSIEQHPLSITSIKEYIHAYVALTFYNYVIPASKSYAEGYISTMKPFSKIFRKKIVVIPNGLDIPKKNSFHTNEKNLEKETVVLGMAARFDDVKDYETVVRALSELNSKNKVRYIFKAAGEGPNRNKIEKLAEDLNQKDNISFLGLLNKPAMETFYDSLDIYIQSTKGEAMSFSMMEAMGHGKVFLGTNVTGVQEFIVNGENGYLFNCGNYQDLAQKIEFIQKNPAIALQLSKGARNYYNEFFSLSAMVKGYSKLMSWASPVENS
jgi:glycosyltransferase involved in cell wall biosynthesis